MQLLEVPPSEENGYVIKATEGKEYTISVSSGVPLQCEVNFPLSAVGTKRFLLYATTPRYK